MSIASTPRFAPMQHGPRLGLGGAPLGNLFAPVPEDEARALLQAAWDDGVRCFDTAPHYGQGRSEHRLGALLRDRAGHVLCSKAGRRLLPDTGAPREQHGYVDVLPFRQVFDYSRAGVRRSVEDSLQRLGVARLDVVHVHDPDAATHGERAPAVLRQVIDEALPELRVLQREGLVGAVGLGVNDVAVVLQVLAEADLDVLMLAGRYTLLDHSALSTLLPRCLQRGVRVALGGVFNSGLLATGTGRSPGTFNYAPAGAAWIERTAALEAVCAAWSVPLRAAALQFPLAHPAVDLVMAGPRSVAEWRDTLAMMAQPLPAGFWDELRRRHLLPDAAPTPDRGEPFRLIQEGAAGNWPKTPENQ